MKISIQLKYPPFLLNFPVGYVILFTRPVFAAHYKTPNVYKNRTEYHVFLSGQYLGKD